MKAIWSGETLYYHREADGKTLEDGALYYLNPKPMTKYLANGMGSWKS